MCLNKNKLTFVCVFILILNKSDNRRNFYYILDSLKENNIKIARQKEKLFFMEKIEKKILCVGVCVLDIIHVTNEYPKEDSDTR